MTEVLAELEKPKATASRSAPLPSPADLAGHGEHPVIRIPFNVVINGRSFVGNGLSIVGADATGLIDPQLHGRVQVVMLVFNFPGYSISLPVDAAIGAGSPEAGTVSLRFLEPTGPHLPQLRYILNAYVGRRSRGRRWPDPQRRSFRGPQGLRCRAQPCGRRSHHRTGRALGGNRRRRPAADRLCRGQAL